MSFVHEPVLLEEAIDHLMLTKESICIDATIGGAGHAEQIVYRLGRTGHLYGFDRDIDAVRAAAKRLARFDDLVTIFHDDYKNALSLLRKQGVEAADAILMDLGISSHQIDEAERGFSYMKDGPLDMRMDRSEAISAGDIVATYSEGMLTQIFREYGEERYAARIAALIVREREESPVDTTFKLNDIILRAIPAKARREGGHPSKRVFQALRIACNRELEGLGETVTDMIDFLSPGGRLAVITFHSLEDRIVKQAFQNAETPCICPPRSPVCTCGRIPKGRRVNKKAIRPTPEEIARNPRAKSASLRVFERAAERG